MKIFKNLNKFHLIIITLVVLVSFGVGHFALADDMGIIARTTLQIIGWVLSWVIAFLGWLITLIITGIIYIAQYNDFIYSPAVMTGWVMVRDLCNMFFILIVLIIAFATILRIERFSIKQLLKKVIIMAILINFSKTICGLMIDAAGVVMMTFVNGFKDLGGPGITQILGIDMMLKLGGLQGDTTTQADQGVDIIDRSDERIANADSGNNTVGFWDIILTYTLALVYMLVAMVVLLAMLGVLITRMIMLWIYIIISPMAYIASVLPSTSSMASKWWSTFTSYVVTGPMLAFFIWLSLSTLMSVSSSNPYNVTTTMLNGPATNGLTTASGSKIGTTDFFIGYVVAIGLLIGGLIVSKEYGGVVGSAAGWGYNQIKGGANWAKQTAMKPVKYAGEKSVQAAKATGRTALSVTTGLAKAADNSMLGGRASRTAGWVKDNFNAQGLKKVKDVMAYGVMSRGGTSTSGSAFAMNSKAAEIRQAVTKNGSWKGENNIVYKKSAEGVITANGESIAGKSKADIDKLLPKIKVGNTELAAELKPMSKFAANAMQGWNSRTMGVKAKTARNKKDKAEVEKFKDDYKDSNENELENLYYGTTNNNRRRAINLIAADKGFTRSWYNKNDADFESQRKDANEQTDFEKTLGDKDRAETLSQMSNVALANEYRQQPFDLQTHDSNNPADLDAMAKKLIVQNEMKKRGLWDKYLQALSNAEMVKTKTEASFMDSESGRVLNKTANRRQAELDRIKNEQTDDKQAQFGQARDLFRNKPNMMKEFMDATAKTRPDFIWDAGKNAPERKGMMDMVKKGKIKLDELKVNHLDPSSLADMVDVFKEALGPERYGAQVNKIDKEGSKDFASNIAEASLINARRQEEIAKTTASVADRDKALRNAHSSRKDFVKLNGDIRKGFTKEGQLDEESLKNFVRNASAKDLEQIDHNSMDSETASIIGGQMTYAKLQQLNRHDENPEIVNKIAEAMVNMNHPEANKIPQGINSSFKVDTKAVAMNKIIQDALRDLKIDVDITKINNFRKTTNEFGGEYELDNSGKFKMNQKPTDTLKNMISKHRW